MLDDTWKAGACRAPVHDDADTSMVLILCCLFDVLFWLEPGMPAATLRPQCKATSCPSPTRCTFFCRPRDLTLCSGMIHGGQMLGFIAIARLSHSTFIAVPKSDGFRVL